MGARDVQSAPELVFNGINGRTGGYLLEPKLPEEVSAYARGSPLDADQLAELRWRYQQATEAHYGVKAGVDPERLEEAGWDVVFAHDADPAIHEALAPLLERRREQAGATRPGRYREFVGADGHRPGESKNAFLARHGVGPGPADPDKVPYYLLLVGEPERIPFRFQYLLDVTYAVGRLHFETPAEYARYARSVVAAETGRAARPRQAAFFGVCNEDDRATRLSAELLVEPLAAALAGDMANQQAGWDVRTILAGEATKARLRQLMGGDQTPALLFSASHGMAFPKDDPRQLARQGALLCQDWPGPRRHRGAIPEDDYLAGTEADVPDDADLTGLIAFHFACDGAGTPRLDDFPQQAFVAQPAELAPQAFVARLPQRLLAHPGGGALAVIGHVDRAWGCSFVWHQAGAQQEVFRSGLQYLMEGRPLGTAVECFNERYAELSTVLSAELEDVSFGKIPDHLELAGLWTACNDARNVVVLGDPAVRLCVCAPPAEPR